MLRTKASAKCRQSQERIAFKNTYYSNGWNIFAKLQVWNFLKKRGRRMITRRIFYSACVLLKI